MSPNRLRLSTFDSQSAGSAAARRDSHEPAALKLQFLASLNHEIRTPLSGMLGMTDLLLETQLDDEQRDYVTAARQCAEGLFELLNDTLEYTSLASGCIQLDESEFHLDDTLQTALAEHATRAQAKELSLRYKAAGELPPTAIGDAYRVRQIASLLIQHAVRVTDTGWIELDASVNHDAPGECVLQITVRSSSTAVSTAQVREIFQTFDEIEAGTTRRFNGIGLGLALTRRVLQLVNGDLVIETDVQGETHITAEVPLKLPKPVLVGQPARGQAHRLAASRILVVEDNKISQQVLSAMLAKGAFEFDCVADGPSAIAAAAARSYQLILMDLQMPGMDGIETAGHVRNLPGYKDTPILALTAEVSDQIRALCRQNGMAAFLNKPVQAAELLASVHRFLPA